MSHFLVLLILEFFPARLAALPYVLDSNVTQLLSNLLTKPSVFYYLSIVSCNLVVIKLLLLFIYKENYICFILFDENYAECIDWGQAYLMTHFRF